MNKFYSVFTFLLLSAPIYSQNPDWVYYTLVEAVSNIVFEENFAWLGTYDNGLIRIDKTTWEKTVYTSSNSDLPANTFHQIAIDKNGNKWIAHQWHGLTKFDGSSWTVFNSSNSDLPNNTVTNIAFDNDDNVWVVCNAYGITKFDGVNWTSYQNSNWIGALAIDKNNNKWIGTYDSGAIKLDGENWTAYNTSNSEIPANWIYSMAFDDSGNAWFGAWGGGLAKFDGTNWTIYNKLNSGLPSDSIFCIAIDDEGNKWMGTQFGLVKFNGTDWTVFNTENSGIFDNFVPYIGIDDNGNKWIGNLYKISIYNENGVVSVEENLNLSTTEFLLSQNYPNPFNPSTTINYQIPEESHVQIKVYDVIGREIQVLVNEQKKAGFYRISFDGSNLSSGIYLYRIDAGNFSSIKKMLLIK